MDHRRIRIVVLGDLIYDCFIWADRLPQMGETVSGYSSGFFSGGKGANQAVQAARLGAEVFLIGKVGADSRGEFLLDELVRDGVDVSHVAQSSLYPTSTCCVHVDKDGNNAIIVAPNANEHITIEEIHNCKDLIKSADVFITQLQVNLEAVEAAVQIAHDFGTLVVLNPAPAKPIPDSLLAMVDYITPNETEAEYYTGLSPLDANLEKMAAYFGQKGVGNLVVTLGKRGAYYASGGESGIVPAFSVTAMDSTAAGDAFTAAFAYASAQGIPLREAVRFGNAVGALTATRKGSQISMPTIQEVLGFLTDRQSLLCE